MNLYEILVPTTKPKHIPGKKRYFTVKYHRLWDAKVIDIAKGMTLLKPVAGSWVSPQGELFKERMIPVRVACTREQIEHIMRITAKHYEQEAVMAYKISDEVLITEYKENCNK